MLPCAELSYKYDMQIQKFSYIKYIFRSAVIYDIQAPKFSYMIYRNAPHCTLLFSDLYSLISVEELESANLEVLGLEQL
jgi:hypothetical protein